MSQATKSAVLPSSPEPAETEPKYLPGLPQPPVRGTCVNGPRPCRYMQCRHHMAPVGPADWPIPLPSCSLDVADRVAAGGVKAPTLEVIGQWFGVTRERVRQIEEPAKEKIRNWMRRLDPDLPEPPKKRTKEQKDAREEETVRKVLHRDGQGEEWVLLRDLVDRSGLSHGAVLRAIHRLRKRGMPIVGRPSHGGGYRWAAPEDTTAARI